MIEIVTSTIIDCFQTKRDMHDLHSFWTYVREKTVPFMHIEIWPFHAVPILLSPALWLWWNICLICLQCLQGPIQYLATLPGTRFHSFLTLSGLVQVRSLTGTVWWVVHNPAPDTISISHWSITSSSPDTSLKPPKDSHIHQVHGPTLVRAQGTINRAW